MKERFKRDLTPEIELFRRFRDILYAMTSTDELTLLRRVATKDRKAFEALYHLYYRRLFGYLLKLTRRAELVEEVLNDVMMAIWKGAASFDGRSRPSTWIFGIAYHKALKALARRRPAAEVDSDAEGGPGPAGGGGGQRCGGRPRAGRPGRAREPGGAPRAGGGAGPGARLPVAGAAGGRRADLLLRARLPRDRGDRGLPGEHGEDADVPRPPALEGIAAGAGRVRICRLGDKTMREQEAHGERVHQRVWELLPWYVNGSLAERERERVETHLAACLRCQGEERICRLMAGEVAKGGEVAPAPHPVQLQRMLARIEESEREEKESASPWRLLAPLRSLVQATPRPLRGALVAQAAVILLLIGFLGWSLSRPLPPP